MCLPKFQSRRSGFGVCVSLFAVARQFGHTGFSPGDRDLGFASVDTAIRFD